MNHLMRAVLVLLVAGLGFLAGALVHPGAAATGPETAKPCANATPTVQPASAKVGVGSYDGWTVRVTRFARHKPADMEAMKPGYALYVLHVIVENRGTQTWNLFTNEFRLEDDHHQVYAQEPLGYYPDVHPLCCDTLTPGTRMVGDVLKEAPAGGHFPRLRVLLPQVAGEPDLVVPLPPLPPK